MARKMTQWPSKREPITKIMPSELIERRLALCHLSYVPFQALSGALFVHGIKGSKKGRGGRAWQGEDVLVRDSLGPYSFGCFADQF